MKLALILALTMWSALAAQTPAFIKVGEVYSFSVAGQREPILASVVKDEGAGWVKVSTVQKRDEFWLNLAQVQIAIAVQQSPDSLKASMDRKQILTNLRGCDVTRCFDRNVVRLKPRGALMTSLENVEKAVNQPGIHDVKIGGIADSFLHPVREVPKRFLRSFHRDGENWPNRRLAHHHVDLFALEPTDHRCFSLGRTWRRCVVEAKFSLLA